MIPLWWATLALAATVALLLAAVAALLIDTRTLRKDRAYTNLEARVAAARKLNGLD